MAQVEPPDTSSRELSRTLLLMGVGLWVVGCGLWLVACGLWLVACGLWVVACGLWLVGCGLRVGKIRPAAHFL